MRRERSITTFTGTPGEPDGRGGRGATPPGGEDDEEGGGRGAATAAGRRRGGHEPVHAGTCAIPNARDFPGLIIWAGEHARPGRAAGTLPGQADGARRLEDAGLRDRAQRERADGHRRRPRRAVHARQGRSTTRSRSRTKPCCASAASRTQIADAHRGEADAALKTAGAGADRQADRRGRRDLPVPEPQQPGSAQLSDQAEQQAGRAAGHRRERRRQADAIRPTPCSRICPARLDKQLARLDALAKYRSRRRSTACSRRSEAASRSEDGERSSCQLSGSQDSSDWL